MAINPGYALQFKRTLDRASEPKRARATGTVTAVSSDSDGKIRSATVSTGSGLLSVPVPYGTNVYTGMTVAITNDGTPSNAQWRLSGTTSVPGGIQGGSIINHDGNTFAMFDSIWVRNDGVIIVGGDVDTDGDPTGPRVESNQCGYFGYDQYDRQSLAIYAANCDGYYAGDVFLGPEEMSRISVLPTEGVIRVVNEGRTSLEFSPDGNFIRDPLTIGNPVGARINIGEIEDKATLVVRGKNGVAKLVARTDDNDDVYLHVGNPPPEDNSMWFDSADGRLNVNGHVTMQSMDVRGRATFSSTGSFLIVDPDDPGRFGVITPKGQYAYTTDALGVVHLIRVDAWGPLTLESEYGSGIWRTWVGGTQIFGDSRYRHFRIERGASARAGLFNGETPVAYIDQTGKGYFTGEVTMESGVVNGDVLITDGGVLTFDAINGKFNSGGIRWEKSGTEYLRIGTQVDLGSVAGNVIDSHTVDLSLYSDGNIYIIPGAGQQTIIGGTSYGDSGSNYAAFSKTGDVTLVGAATFTTPNGIIRPSWKPTSDSTTALQLQNAAGTPIVTVDTSNKRLVLPYGAIYHGTYPALRVNGALGNVFAGGSGNDTATGANNIGFGDGALVNLSSGTNNFAAGYGALYSTTTGNSNFALGLMALAYSSGDGNTGIGNYAGQYFGSNSVAIGYQAGNRETGNHKLFIDNQDRSSEAGGRIGSLVYGEFNATVASQLFRTNGVFQQLMNDSATSTPTTGVKISHNSSGTVANGFGSRVLWELDSSTTADQTAAAIDVAWTNATHASRASGIKMQPVSSGGLVNALFVGPTELVVNDDQGNYDFRVEGDTSGYVLFVDASADAVGIGTQTPATRLHVQVTDARTNDRANMLTLEHNTTGTPTKGFASGVLFQLESDTTTSQDAALIEASWDVATHASRAGVVSLYGSYTGTMYKGLSVGAVSGAAALSFYGVPMIAQPTTSHAAASFTANSGTAVNDASTFDGYTLKQVVKALRDLGILT